NLTQYDTPSSGSGNSKPSTGGNNGNSGNNSQNSTYTVVSGDTLSKIARQHSVTVAQLKQWNNLKSDLIYPGQVLKVKGDNKPTTNTKPTNKPPVDTSNTTKPVDEKPTSGKKHVVKSGDTLYGISLKYGVSVNQIKQWNNLKSDVIYVNQTLIVKDGQTTNVKPNPPKGSPNTNSVANKTHIVKGGDTLYGISLRYGVSISDIKQKNNLTSDIIYIGQKLIISESNQSVAKGNDSQPIST
ncbi:LysM peptidoglycan-binding domain-containing protein, partial [Acinetobacter baumannii]|nr:LysM peptidoglycan-binding domain-containing protein [Acinetobacter baumannii]